MTRAYPLSTPHAGGAGGQVMHSKKFVFTLMIAATSAIACHKSSERERREAQRAAERVEEKSDKAVKDAIDETNDFLAAVKREQLDYRGRIQDEIDRLDKKLFDMRVAPQADGTYPIDPNSKEANRVGELVARRQLLERDLQAVEDADPASWNSVKAQVEKDLGLRRLRGRI